LERVAAAPGPNYEAETKVFYIALPD
jgi:hypothetical protein